MRRHVVGLVLGILTFSICASIIWLWREMSRAVFDVPAHLEQPIEPVSLRELNTLTNAPTFPDNYFGKFNGLMISEGWSEKRLLDLPRIKKQKDWIALYYHSPIRMELRRVNITIDERPVDDDGRVHADYAKITVAGYQHSSQSRIVYLFAGIENIKPGELEMVDLRSKYGQIISLMWRDENEPLNVFFDLGGKNYWIYGRRFYNGKSGIDQISASPFLSDGTSSQYLINTDAPGGKLWNATVLHLGNLDGDAKPDMILDVGPPHEEEHYTILMLSTEAKPGRLLAPAASLKYTIDGC